APLVAVAVVGCTEQTAEEPTSVLFPFHLDLVLHVVHSPHRLGNVFCQSFRLAIGHSTGHCHFTVFDVHLDITCIDLRVSFELFAQVFLNAFVRTSPAFRTTACIAALSLHDAAVLRLLVAHASIVVLRARSTGIALRARTAVPTATTVVCAAPC